MLINLGWNLSDSFLAQHTFQTCCSHKQSEQHYSECPCQIHCALVTKPQVSSCPQNMKYPWFSMEAVQHNHFHWEVNAVFQNNHSKAFLNYYKESILSSQGERSLKLGAHTREIKPLKWKETMPRRSYVWKFSQAMKFYWRVERRSWEYQTFNLRKWVIPCHSADQDDSIILAPQDVWEELATWSSGSLQAQLAAARPCLMGKMDAGKSQLMMTGDSSTSRETELGWGNPAPNATVSTVETHANF